MTVMERSRRLLKGRAGAQEAILHTARVPANGQGTLSACVELSFIRLGERSSMVKSKGLRSKAGQQLKLIPLHPHSPLCDFRQVTDSPFPHLQNGDAI